MGTEGPWGSWQCARSGVQPGTGFIIHPLLFSIVLWTTNLQQNNNKTFSRGLSGDILSKNETAAPPFAHNLQCTGVCTKHRSGAERGTNVLRSWVSSF